MQELALNYEGSDFLVQSDDPADLAWLQTFLGPAFQTGNASTPRRFTLKSDAAFLAKARCLDSSSAARLAAFVLDSGVEELPCTEDGNGITAYDTFFDVAYRRAESTELFDDWTAGPGRRARGALMRVIRERAMDHAWRSGASILHGASFTVGGRAVLVAGDKEAGKTSLLCAALMAASESQMLSNDRLLLRLGAAGLHACALPSIVSVRFGSTKVVPKLSDALSNLSATYLGATTTTGDVPSRWILSPPQFAAALGSSLRREADVACCVLPCIDVEENTFRLRELEGEERAHRIAGCVFAKDSLGRHSLLFGDQDGTPFPGTGELRKRLLKAFDGIRCHELRMGPALYQPEHMRHLIGQLLS